MDGLCDDPDVQSRTDDAGKPDDLRKVTSGLEGGSWKRIASDTSLAAYPTRSDGWQHSALRCGTTRARDAPSWPGGRGLLRGPGERGGLLVPRLRHGLSGRPEPAVSVASLPPVACLLPNPAMNNTSAMASKLDEAARLPTRCGLQVWDRQAQITAAAAGNTTGTFDTKVTVS
jgi:hypothetical protein